MLLGVGFVGKDTVCGRSAVAEDDMSKSFGRRIETGRQRDCRGHCSTAMPAACGRRFVVIPRRAHAIHAIGDEVKRCHRPSQTEVAQGGGECSEQFGPPKGVFSAKTRQAHARSPCLTPVVTAERRSPFWDSSELQAGAAQRLREGEMSSNLFPKRSESSCAVAARREADDRPSDQKCRPETDHGRSIRCGTARASVQRGPAHA